MATQFKVVEATNPEDLEARLMSWRAAIPAIQSVEYHYAIDGDDEGFTYSVLLIWESIE